MKWKIQTEEEKPEVFFSAAASENAVINLLSR